MSDSRRDYEAFREFARATIALEVVRATAPLHEEIRSLRTQLETRAATPLMGPPGPAGADGAPGRDGVDGKDGRDGKDGERGPAGERGERGADGLAGRDGVPGPRGEQGERGADGIATREEIVEIVEERAAEIQTRTLADYHQRTFERGGHYKRGALVAWDGATWLAMADTDVVPGTSSDWQMIAKKGRDGRDRK